MKNKKIFTTITAALLAAAMGFTLAACGNKDGENGGENGGGGNAGGNTYTAESLVSEQVNAEQWAAAFAEENFTNVKIESVSTQTVEGKQITNKMTIVIAGDISYFKSEYEGLTEEMEESGEYPEMEQYYSNTEEGYVAYVKAGQEWVSSKIESTPIESVLDGMVLAYAESQEQYSFSETHKGYVVEGEEGTGEAPIIKFKDGKLAAYVVSTEELKATVLITYGNQKLTLPTVASAD